MNDSVIDSDWQPLNHRERFRRQMHFQTVDHGVHWEFGYLNETLQRWHEEGLPPDLNNNWKVESFFGVDPRAHVPTTMNVVPGFEGETQVIEETENRRVVKQPDGTILEQRIEGRQTIPHYIKFPIENRDDWKRFKERLNPYDPKRFETDWRKVGQELERADRPVGIGFGSYLGWPRNWIGFENLAVMCYDDRQLLEEIVATLGEVFHQQLKAALRHCRVDFAAGWEDICFRNGPLISPAMFREICIPHIERNCRLLREHGCDVIYTDCDGDINQLVPLWLEAGLNCMFPVEVGAGSDPVELRKTYGRQILLIGGIRKYELAKGKDEILAELKRIEPLVHEGGYIPHGDHRIPDDVPFENYKYYIKEKLSMLGWSRAEMEQVEPIGDMI